MKVEQPKSFEITKQIVWDAFKRVKVDGGKEELMHNPFKNLKQI